MAKETKPVILAGDLNAAPRREDRHWTMRSITVNDDVLPGWSKIVQALRKRQVVSTVTKNPKTGVEFQKFRTQVLCAETGKPVQIGSHYSSRDEAFFDYEVDGLFVNDEGEFVVVNDGGGLLQVAAPNVVNIKDVGELAEKILNVKFSDFQLKNLLETAPPPPHDKRRAFLDELRMVDAFAALHPDAKERFTCWDQYRNKRHENIGSRIDAFFLDPGLFQKHSPVPGVLDSATTIDGEDPNTALAARRAATLNGRFRPAPFEGGGLPDPVTSDCLHHCQRQPHTGIVYTPPSWSDHVAISLLLTNISRHQGQPSTTKAPALTCCQPHAQVRTITAFFKPKSKDDPPPAPKRPKINNGPAQPKGIRKFFAVERL